MDDDRLLCPVCGSGELSTVISVENVPSQDGVLWSSVEAARIAPLGDIQLVLCGRCSYLWNVMHDAAKVSFSGYDVSLQHSPLFQAFISELVDRLASEYNLRDGTVLEIGCGRGYFLDALCTRAGCRGLGFDPSYRPAPGVSALNPNVSFVAEPYGEKHLGPPAELVVCRHVLDVLGDQSGMLDLVRRTLELRSGAATYFEVPDARYTFGERIPWNLVYEHKTWFVPDSIEYLFATCGLDVTRITSCWQDEYLGVEATAGGDTHRKQPVSPLDNGFASMLASFADHVVSARSAWTDRARALVANGESAAIWGAGARAIGFLSLVPSIEPAIPYVVDINPARQDLYLPRNALRVSAPERLLEEPPDLLLISNPTYANEIAAHARSLGVTAEIEVLHAGG